MSSCFIRSSSLISSCRHILRKYGKDSKPIKISKQKRKTNLNHNTKARHQRFDKIETSDFGNEFLYGRSVCNLALLSSRRPIFKMFINSKWEVQEPEDPRVQTSLKEAEERNIPIEFVSVSDLFEITQGFPHQGICLEVGQLPVIPLTQDTITSLIHHKLEQCPVWVLLYDIIDPMNVGNILRTCHFLGVHAVIMTPQCAPLSSSACKASSGATEIMQIYSVRKPTQFIQDMSEKNWEILGTDIFREDNNTHCPVLDVVEHKVTKPSLLILGSEGSGIPSDVKEICTKLLTIKPLKTNTENPQLSVPCLNVSAATAIILHQILLNRR
uniref:rRNA methyltransferase 1, mitochondrial isoform X1 n=1 Tax=Ciona intestinalis TaxID=7719 RepID=UPI000180D0C4|nr:rRNA methyltransferase 1, mitochondrial isoform X1 [Ciona intestinalis]|eukprot:XP_026690598.1 rRNA methyltransferase 1, mitochondrial isoform X1 [Ciona intestinalis]